MFDASCIPGAVHERGLHELGVGCNRLRCRKCKQWVLREGPTYRCGCREAVAIDVYLARQGNLALDPPHVPWRCAGHPPATPEEDDALGYTEDLAGDVLARVTAEPAAHHPDPHQGYAADLRLDLDTVASQRAVYPVLSALLDGDEPASVLAAMDVLHYRDQLPLDRVVERHARFQDLPNPRFPRQNLASHYAFFIAQQAIAAGVGSPAMAAARTLHEALGDAAGDVRFALR